MKRIALVLSALVAILAMIQIWQQSSAVKTSDHVTRDAPLSLWQTANPSSEG